MDESFPVHHETQPRPDIIRSLADYLRQYPHDLGDAKILLRRFRASASEFYQALLLLDRQQTPQAS